MSVHDLAVDTRIEQLRNALGDRIILSGDAATTSTASRGTSVDQRPARRRPPAQRRRGQVAVPRGRRAAGLRVAPQGTGHGAGALGEKDLSDVVIAALAPS